MKSELCWSERVENKDGSNPPVYSIAFAPDGKSLVAAAGNRVLMYATPADEAGLPHLLNSLKGHKDAVYCVDYARDGARFASGGADNCVIIWTSAGAGVLKYSHADSIQALAYNPVTPHLASCSAVDFGLWTPTQKSVTKHKVPAKILCCSWTADGQHLALGMANGGVSIRDVAGAEKALIERSEPVFAVSFSPALDEPFDVLAVGCWDQTLTFWQLSGAQHGKTRKLGADTCGLAWFGKGEYVVAGGSDRAATLCTREGITLGAVSKGADWVWGVAVHTPSSQTVATCAAQLGGRSGGGKGGPGEGGGSGGASLELRNPVAASLLRERMMPLVATASNDGTISLHRLAFPRLHALYRARFAYRANLTDVIVQVRPRTCRLADLLAMSPPSSSARSRLTSLLVSPLLSLLYLFAHTHSTSPRSRRCASSAATSCARWPSTAAGWPCSCRTA
jgi:intraflagellar transport protein 122